jgi:hypothetical protein
MRSMPMPSLSHYTGSLLNPKIALALAKERPVSVRMAQGKPKPFQTR